MIQTLRTLIRASAAETEERLINGNAATLLAQHLRDATEAHRRARHETAQLMARQQAEHRRAVRLRTELAERETQARAALAAGQEDLAGQIADRIAGIEDRMATSERTATDLSPRIEKLREAADRAGTRIDQLKDELRAARAATAARGTLARIDPGLGALARAEDCAERQREAVHLANDTDTALGALASGTPDSLDQRIRDAGLPTPDTTRRAAILARLSKTTDAN